MRCVSAQQHRQIHSIRCRESHADKIRNECDACVRACQRVGVSESLRACGETRLSFPRGAGGCKRAHACGTPSSPAYTPQPAEYPRVPPRVPVECLLRARVHSAENAQSAHSSTPREPLVPLAAPWHPGLPLRTPRVPLKYPSSTPSTPSNTPVSTLVECLVSTGSIA
jgi:hypothetical protein